MRPTRRELAERLYRMPPIREVVDLAGRRWRVRWAISVDGLPDDGGSVHLEHAAPPPVLHRYDTGIGLLQQIDDGEMRVV